MYVYYRLHKKTPKTIPDIYKTYGRLCKVTVKPIQNYLQKPCKDPMQNLCRNGDNTTQVENLPVYVNGYRRT